MKQKRHDRIIELISKKNIETQEELAKLLKNSGFDVTQATVSRDIRELKLSKMPSNDGRQKYVAANPQEDYLNDKYVRVLRDGYLSVDIAQNILVIKTVSGMAMAVAAAIDALKFEEVVGSIAGDDTIMAAVRSADEAKILMEKIVQML